MAEAVQVIRYRAFDGAMFDSEAEALDHEEANFELLLTNLSLAEVKSAIGRDPRYSAVSAALEKAGNSIARARREAGEYRRTPPRRTSGDLDPAADPAPAPEAPLGGLTPTQFAAGLRAHPHAHEDSPPPDAAPSSHAMLGSRHETEDA